MASTSQNQEKIPSEDIIARKTDLCISNGIVKTGLGFGAGVVLSVLLFRRRAFPVWLGTGFGAGSAYTDCERSFNPYSSPGLRVVPSNLSNSKSSQAPTTALQRLSQRAGEALDGAREQAGPKIEEAKQEIKSKSEEAKGKAKDAAKQIEQKVRQV